MKLYSFLVVAAFIVAVHTKPASSEDFDYNIYFISNLNCETNDEECFPQIFKMNPDGSDITQVTDENFSYQNLRLALNGEALLFEISDREYIDIAYMSIKDGYVEYLTDDGGESLDYYSIFNREGTWAIYSSLKTADVDNNKYDYSLWKLDIETGKKTKLTKSNQNERFPALSPDESEIVYLQSKNTYKERKIYNGYIDFDYYGHYSSYNLSDDTLQYLDLETGESGTLGDVEYGYNAPVYSPNGEYIATSIQYNEKRNEFALMTRDGEIVASYSPEKGLICDNFVFTPDSNIVIFKCGKSHGEMGDKFVSKMYAMYINDGYETEQITANDIYVAHINNFAPDGNTLVFLGYSVEQYCGYNIYSINIDSLEMIRLTNSKETNWSGFYFPVAVPIAVEE